MNKGEFSSWIVSNTDARCVGVEPVPELYRCYPRAIELKLSRRRWRRARQAKTLRATRDVRVARFHRVTRDGDRLEVEVITLDA